MPKVCSDNSATRWCCAQVAQLKIATKKCYPSRQTLKAVRQRVRNIKRPIAQAAAAAAPASRAPQTHPASALISATRAVADSAFVDVDGYSPVAQTPVLPLLVAPAGVGAMGLPGWPAAFSGLGVEIGPMYTSAAANIHPLYCPFPNLPMELRSTTSSCSTGPFISTSTIFLAAYDQSKCASSSLFFVPPASPTGGGSRYQNFMRRMAAAHLQQYFLCAAAAAPRPSFLSHSVNSSWPQIPYASPIGWAPNFSPGATSSSSSSSFWPTSPSSGVDLMDLSRVSGHINTQRLGAAVSNASSQAAVAECLSSSSLCGPHDPKQRRVDAYLNGAITNDAVPSVRRGPVPELVAPLPPPVCLAGVPFASPSAVSGASSSVSVSGAELYPLTPDGSSARRSAEAAATATSAFGDGIGSSRVSNYRNSWQMWL